jgi:hypothetical protein
MKFLAAMPLLLLTTAALAQDVPEQTSMDLWCGIAFGIVSADAPTDVNAEQQAVIDQFRQGGVDLLAKAKAVHLESGFTEESFATQLASVTTDVNTQVNASDNSARYTFEACSALIGL